MTEETKAQDKPVLKPVITIFGVGGAGGNAVNNMIAAKLQGANFVVANTDAQALELSSCSNKIQLGINITKGLGAGASPEVGAQAAEESSAEIKNYLENSNMVFITAGMGGGTGTGAAPIVAKLAKEIGILTVCVVTMPFDFEGKRRRKTADGGFAELQKHCDTLIVIPNQNLFRVTNELTSFVDAFKMADDVLRAGVQSVTDLMIMPGLINLDFADIRAVMSQMGKAMMGTGEASGDNRAIQAAEDAISNPLLDHNSMRGAKGVLINISGADMTLFEVNAAVDRIREEVGEDTDANIIFGAIFNPDLKGIIRVSVIATGIDAEEYLNATNSYRSETSQLPSVEQEFVLDEPEIFDNYNISNNKNSVEENLNLNSEENIFSEEKDFNSHREDIDRENIFDNEQSAPAPKTSFFGKMWKSLKSPEKTSSLPQQPLINDRQLLDRSVGIKPVYNKSSEISEAPAFFRNRNN